MEAYLLLLTFYSFFSSFPLSHSHPDDGYGDCQPSPCGKVGNITYPFWSEEINRPPYCGRSPEFKLNCPQDEDYHPSIQIGSQTFDVTNINLSTYSNTMTLVRTDFVYNSCSSPFTNTSVSIPRNLFHYDDDPPVRYVTLLYDCPQVSWGISFACQPGISSNSNSVNYAFYTEFVVREPGFPYLIEKCKHNIRLPVSIEHYLQAPEEVLGEGFRVKFDVDDSCGKCLDSHGICGSNDTSPFICYCPDGHYSHNCPDSSGTGLFISFSHFFYLLSFHSSPTKFILSY